MKIVLLILTSYFIILLSLSFSASAIPSDEDTVVFRNWAIPIPIYENNSFFPISSSFGGNYLYFAESNSNKIGLLVPSTNTITEWNIPTNASMPVSIGFDPSTGNVYFAESNSNKIGRLVPSTNTITEWNLKEKPQEIIVNSAGSVLFIDKAEKTIHRLS